MAGVKGSGRRRQKALRYARSHPPTQWQGDNTQGPFFGGSTGCAATAVQFILALHGKKVSLREIQTVAGYPDAEQYRNRIGLWDHQVVEVLAHYGVRYKYTTKLSYRDLMRISVRVGPVLFACTYGWWPERRGSVYYGQRADGKPNGYAQSDGRGGKDQLSGFENGRHMGVLLSKRHRSGTPDSATKVYLWDPNHGSTARRHIPDYDVVTPNQWRQLYVSARLTSRNGRPMALVPLDDILD